MARTTVTLPSDLVDELMQSTHARTKTQAVTLAVSDAVRRSKLAGLHALVGSVEICLAAEELRHGDRRLG